MATTEGTFNADGTMTSVASPFKSSTPSSLATRLAGGGYADPALASLTAGVKNAVTTASNNIKTSLAPKPQAPAPAPTNGINLKPEQMALLKKNNPTLYNSLYGNTPVEMNVDEIGTQDTNLGGITQTTGTSSSDNSVITSAETNALTQQQQDQQGGDVTGMSEQDMLKEWMRGNFLAGQEFDPSKIKQEEGVYAAKEQLNAINNKIIAEGKATRDRIMEMRQNPTGMSAQALASDIENYQYERANYMADLAIQQMAWQGNYDGALEIANDRISAEETKYNRQMQFFKDYYTILQDDLTESEKLRFQSQLAINEYNVKSYIDNKTEALRVAGVNNAPPEVIMAIKNAQSADEAWVAAGQYGIDPNISLARDKFAFDREMAWKNYNLQQAKVAGDISQETYDKMVQQQVMDTKYNQLQTALSDVLSNKTGFAVSTGAVTGPLASSFLTWGGGKTYYENRYAQNELAANMDYIVNNLTSEGLADAKARGITFGALSENEMQVLGATADRLSKIWDSENKRFTVAPNVADQYLRETYQVFENKKNDNKLGVATSQAIDAEYNK